MDNPNISPTDNVRFLVTPGLRIVMAFLAWIVGSILLVFVTFILGRVLDNNYLAYIRISTVFQDILMWIVPALVTAMVITRQPARFLAIDRLPSFRHVVLGILLLIVSTPFMSWIIRLNADIHFPESMVGLEQTLRTLEENAENTVKMMFENRTPASLVINILIIGIFAGFSEELFFRGTLQRVFASSNLSVHAAIWITAFIFSVLHIQFFGFFPRMLLGAAFGYMLYWSGSVWLPMLIHTLNNSIYVILYYSTGSGEPEIASADSWVTIAISIILTAAVVASFSKFNKKNKI